MTQWNGFSDPRNALETTHTGPTYEGGPGHDHAASEVRNGWVRAGDL